jgi:type I site-specific restriction endonuclease
MEKPRDTYSLNEAQARYVLINPALRQAGWNLDNRAQIGFEVPVDGYDAESRNGVTNFGCKRTMIAPHYGSSSQVT